MKYLIIILAIIISVFKYNFLLSGEFDPKTTPGNYHYSGKYCTDCHEKEPGIKGKKLKYNGNFNLLCKCHFEDYELYIHPVDIEPSKEKKIPPSFPLRNGKVVCTTCHNVFLQCQESPFKKTSLRGAPYGRRYDVCYVCHNAKDYEMLNPHKQLDSEKKIIAEQCLYCHIEMPDEKYSGSKDIVLKTSIAVLCQRCHNIKGNHSGNVNHILKPSAKILKQMKKMEEQFNIILPLDSDGKLTCATCHNPHEKGVIDSDKPSSKGADEKYRHRLPGRICTECHQM